MAANPRTEWASWIAGILSALLALVALALSFWPRNPEAPQPHVAQSASSVGTQIGTVSGNVTVVNNPPQAAASTPQPPATPAFASTSRPLKEWDDCVARAESSVSQQQVGVWGVEATIRERCGSRPVVEPDTKVGEVPYDLVRSKTWAPKFRLILGDSYDAFVERIVVSSETELEGEWVVASGLMPHNGGDDEAAFAINKRTGAVYAAMLEDGKDLSGFGFGSSWSDAPPFLQRWTAEKKR
ncbi:MAG: hypothetical protein E6Q61_01295 [Nitrosomonas sp.]|nr:MAG: hypothetical protein E6Q61_01295 [Nitrosomonas sp.]